MITLPHVNSTYVHSSKHLILLRCLRQKCEDIEFQPLYVRMIVRITKPKQELESRGSLRKMDDFAMCFKL